VNKDGSPHVSPMWVDVDEARGLILLNTAEGRQKLRNVRRDPRVALSSHDALSPWPPLIIRGTVLNITSEGADAHIDLLSKRYTGDPWDPVAGQIRLIFEVRPESVFFPSD
jgi:PPOX class probable F420-dependent enzyme